MNTTMTNSGPSDEGIYFHCKGHGREIIMRLDGTDHTFGAVVEHFREFALALGFHPDTVKHYIDEE